jgi:hypothetical protein
LIYYSSTTILCFANAGVFSYSQTTSERLKIAFAYKSGDSALYVNGVQKTLSSASSSNYSIPSSSRISLGARAYGSGADRDLFVNGKIDHVRMFNRVITQSEVNALYNSGTGA